MRGERRIVATSARGALSSDRDRLQVSTADGGAVDDDAVCLAALLGGDGRRLHFGRPLRLNFVVPQTTFDPDYFYCHVEPGFIFANKCGSGDPSKGDPPNGCHFTSSVVSGMALIDHMPVDCGGGDHPVSTTQTGTGSAAEGNYEAVSLEMNTDYTTAPVFVRPSGSNHPRQIFSTNDMTVNQLLSTWASK